MRREETEFEKRVKEIALHYDTGEISSETAMADILDELSTFKPDGDEDGK